MRRVEAREFEKIKENMIELRQRVIVLIP